MPVLERPPSAMIANRPRVASNRVDADNPNRGASPQPDVDPLRTSTSSQKHRSSRDQRTMSEKRTERTVISTKEKAVRRNPVKESSSATNRGDGERSRSKKPSQAEGASPGSRKRDPDTVDGQLPNNTRVDVSQLTGLLYSSMGPASISDSSLNCPASLSCICSAVGLGRSAVPLPPAIPRTFI